MAFHLRQKNVAVLAADHLTRIEVVLVLVGRIGAVRRVVDRGAVFLGEPHLLRAGIGSRVKIRHRRAHDLCPQYRNVDRHIDHIACLLGKAVRIVLVGHEDLIVFLPFHLISALIRVPDARVRRCNVSKQLETLLIDVRDVVGSLVWLQGIPVNITLDLSGFDSGAGAHGLYQNVNRTRQRIRDRFQAGPVGEFHLARPLDRHDLCLGHSPGIACRDALESYQRVGDAHDDRNQSAGIQLCLFSVHINLDILVKNIAVAGDQRELRRVGPVKLELCLPVRIIQQVIEDRDNARPVHHRENLHALQPLLRLREHRPHAFRAGKADMLGVDVVRLGQNLAPAGLRRSGHDQIHALDLLIVADLTRILNLFVLEIRLDLHIFIRHDEGNILLDRAFLQLQSGRLHHGPSGKCAGLLVHSGDVVQKRRHIVISQHTCDCTGRIAHLLQAGLIIRKAEDRLARCILSASRSVGDRNSMRALLQTVGKRSKRAHLGAVLLHAVGLNDAALGDRDGVAIIFFRILLYFIPGNVKDRVEDIDIGLLCKQGDILRPGIRASLRIRLGRYQIARARYDHVHRGLQAAFGRNAVLQP